MACHAVDKQSSWAPPTRMLPKYAGQKDAEATLITHVLKGSKGVWGPVPMPANAQVNEAEARSWSTGFCRSVIGSLPGLADRVGKQDKPPPILPRTRRFGMMQKVVRQGTPLIRHKRCVQPALLAPSFYFVAKRAARHALNPASALRWRGFWINWFQPIDPELRGFPACWCLGDGFAFGDGAQQAAHDLAAAGLGQVVAEANVLGAWRWGRSPWPPSRAVPWRSVWLPRLWDGCA